MPGPPPAVPAPAARVDDARPSGREVVNIGKSVVIKGELNGSEDLTVEGHVEGRVELRDHVLTIGPNGRIKAEVFAKAVHLGKVQTIIIDPNGVSHAVGLRSIRWMIMSDAAYATCTRASVGVFPGLTTNVTGVPGIVNAVSAPDGGAVTSARIAGMHETFVTSNIATLSARTSRTRPYPSVAQSPVGEGGCWA